MTVEELASYRHCHDRVTGAWEPFAARRRQLLRQGERFGKLPERAAEEIVRELFTVVLDWSVGDVNYQVDFADILLTRMGIKHLVVETKRPGMLLGSQQAVTAALQQARRYASVQSVRRIAVCDGSLLYAEDLEHGKTSPRAFALLDQQVAPARELWWLSYQGIYRPRPNPERLTVSRRLRRDAAEPDIDVAAQSGLLHPKYHLPARCFGYVGDPGDPRTWKLPYLLGDGRPDPRRLPKAVQALLTNYRGAVASTVPEDAVIDTLVRLGCAVGMLGKMPGQCPEPAAVYVELAAALTQAGRLAELGLVQV
jgi:hypothetical protein